MKRKWFEKSGVIALRSAVFGKHIVYSLKSAPGRKINAIFCCFQPYLWAPNYCREAAFELFNLDVYGLRTRAIVKETDIFQVKFVDSFPFERMDFDMGI